MEKEIEEKTHFKVIRIFNKKSTPEKILQQILIVKNNKAFQSINEGK